MPKIKSSPRFIKAYVKLSAAIRKRVDKAILLLEENPRHPSLQTKPIQGREGVYEARVDIHYRMTYNRLRNNFLVMRTVGRHDDVLRNP